MTIQTVVCMYGLLCVFMSQCSNRVDFISMAEAQKGVGKSQTWGQGLLVSPGAATN